MATIILKGTDKKIECSLAVCDRVNKLKSEKVNPKTEIEVDGIVLELGDIRYAIRDGEKDNELERERKKAEYGEMIEKNNKEFYEEIRRYALGSIEGKISFNLKIAEMYCFAITGGGINDYRLQVEGIIKDELTRERLIVKPTRYLKIFRTNDIKAEELKIEGLIRKQPFRLMEKYLGEVYDVLARI